MKNKNLLGLASTHSINYVLIAGIILCVIQFGFSVVLDEISLSVIIDHPFFKYTFLTAFVFALMLCGTFIKGSLSKITLNRLGISQKIMFLDLTLNTAVSLVIIWAFQIFSLLLISVYFVMNSQEQFVNPQTIYLASFRSYFFHLILPLGDYVLWFSGLSLILVNSVVTARYVLSDVKDPLVAISTTFSILYFGGGVNGFAIGMVFLLIGLYQLYKGVTKNEEKS